MAKKKLQVTIIGAGIAGTIATRVVREHHDVTLIERTPSTRLEVGAAINLGPTVTAFLDTMGFDRVNAGALVATQSRTFNGKTGEKLSTVDMTKFAKHTKADWLFQHRADLWSEFFRLATAPAEEVGLTNSSGTVKVIWEAEVTDVDVESGDVKLAGGRVIASDLVIGADGIKSVVRPLVVGEYASRTARPSGASAFRLTLPAEKLLAKYPELFDKTAPVGLDVHLSLDPSNRSIVMYPCRDFELLNLVCIVQDGYLGIETEESWSADGRKADLLRCYDDFSPKLKHLLNTADEVKLWQLRDQDPLPTYILGRTVIIGDAAHAMTPHQGQGGTQAVEDAEGLTILATATRESVPSMLKDFDRVRRKRASQIQDNTREAHDRKTGEDLWKHSVYNWSYPGILECLTRLDEGREMIDI